MKAYSKKKLGILLFVSLLLASCDLELQKGYDFKPEIDLTDPHDDITAWEFIQTQTSHFVDEETGQVSVFDSLGRYDGDKMDYMIEAIKKAGMEDEYNQTETIDRTYLFLDNNAFNFRLSSRNVINLITGEGTIEFETAQEVIDKVDTPEELERLRTLLRYHIVTSYIDQVPTLSNTEERYLFQSLIEGNKGQIVFSRSSRWQIQVNRDPAPLPESATDFFANAIKHNYVFSNGIGHYINSYVRYEPY